MWLRTAMNYQYRYGGGLPRAPLAEPRVSLGWNSRTFCHVRSVISIYLSSFFLRSNCAFYICIDLLHISPPPCGTLATVHHHLEPNVYIYALYFSSVDLYSPLGSKSHTRGTAYPVIPGSGLEKGDLYFSNQSFFCYLSSLGCLFLFCTLISWR